jgi:hypothetical protein
LFESEEPDVYVFDTSAWVNVKSHRKSDDLWVTIIDLIGHRRLVTCPQVMTELKPDPIYKQVKRYEKALLAHSGKLSNPEFRIAVGRITHDSPGMCKARGEKTPADPYVIALAQLEDYVVIADEGTVKRQTRKIPGACRALGICCKTLDEFFTAEMKN